MKKSLVAIAALTLVGAASAQVTMTGNYTGGFKSTKAAGKDTVAGFGTDTAAIQFMATEDLGGGTKASARVSIANASREAQGGAGTDNYVKGEDAYVALSGGFGTFKLGTLEITNGLLAVGSSGAAGFGLDGNVISGSANLDYVGYSVPMSSALTFGASYTETAGLGVGTNGASAGQPGWTAGVTYAAGALTAKIDATSYAREGDALVTSNTAQNRYRLSAAYDMGAARLSAGYSRKASVNSGVATETLLGLKVPAGAVTLGLDYGVAKTEAAGVTTKDANGFSLGASYALSKRTSISASYLSWKDDKAASTDQSTGTRVFLSHSF